MSIWRKNQRDTFRARRLRRRQRRTGEDPRGDNGAFGGWGTPGPTPAQAPAPGGTGEPSAGTDDGPGRVKDPGWQPHRQTIELALLRPQDMFEVSQTDLFSEYRNFLSGVEFCISELKARRSGRPVRLNIRLPPDQIDDAVGENLTQTLRRYCTNRMRYNRRETRSLRFNGIDALRVGIPVAAVGFLMVAAATKIRPSDGADHVIVDHLGWVLLWLGLWFPLDEFFFYPLAYGRENRVLQTLYEAEVAIEPLSEPAAEPSPTGPG